MIYIKTNLKKLILLSKRLLRTLIDFIIIFIFSIKNFSKEKKLPLLNFSVGVLFHNKKIIDL